jgi:hypothetical protein
LLITQHHFADVTLSPTLESMPGAFDTPFEAGDDPEWLDEEKARDEAVEAASLADTWSPYIPWEPDPASLLGELDDEEAASLSDASDGGLKRDSARATQIKLAAEAADSPDLPPPPRKRPAEVADLGSQRADRPDDDTSHERGDGSADDASESERHPDVTVEEAEEEFRDTLHGVRLVYDFGSNEVVGIATWDADDWSWQITPAETTAERESRQAGINFLTDLAAHATGLVLAPLTGMDEAATIVAAAADPRSIALKLCNGAAQVLAHHCGLGFMAPELGSLVEQTLSPVIDPPNRLSGAVQGLQALDVTVDVATGHLTPAVQDFAATELDATLQKKTQGISRAELDEIEEAIGRNQAVGP